MSLTITPVLFDFDMFLAELGEKQDVQKVEVWKYEKKLSDQYKSVSKN
jgi:hypothetical protein